MTATKKKAAKKTAAKKRSAEKKSVKKSTKVNKSQHFEPDSKPEINRLYPEISEKQERFIIRYIGTNRSIETCAKEIGITRHAVHKWKQDPMFVAALESERVSLLQKAREKTPVLVEHAYDTLLELHNDPETPLKDKATIYLRFLDRSGYLAQSDDKQLKEKRIREIADEMARMMEDGYPGE